MNYFPIILLAIAILVSIGIIVFIIIKIKGNKEVDIAQNQNISQNQNVVQNIPIDYDIPASTNYNKIVPANAVNSNKNSNGNVTPETPLPQAENKIIPANTSKNSNGNITPETPLPQAENKNSNVNKNNIKVSGNKVVSGVNISANNSANYKFTSNNTVVPDTNSVSISNSGPQNSAPKMANIGISIIPNSNVANNNSANVANNAPNVANSNAINSNVANSNANNSNANNSNVANSNANKLKESVIKAVSLATIKLAKPKIEPKAEPKFLSFDCLSAEKAAIEKKYEDMFPPYKMHVLDIGRSSYGDNNKVCDVLFEYKENSDAAPAYGHRSVKFELNPDYEWDITDMGRGNASKNYNDFYECSDPESNIFQKDVSATTDNYTYTVQSIKKIDSSGRGNKSCEIIYLMNPTFYCQTSDVSKCSRAYGYAKAMYDYNPSDNDWELKDVDYNYRPPR